MAGERLVKALPDGFADRLKDLAGRAEFAARLPRDQARIEGEQIASQLRRLARFPRP